MFSDWLADLTFANRVALISISLGLVLTLGVFLMARRIAATQRPSQAPAPPMNNGEAIRDPFVHGPEDEKRIAHRRNGNLVNVLVAELDRESSPWSGVVTNRSVGGLRLVQENAVAVGTVLNVRPGRSSEPVPWTQVEVRNCQKTTSGWELGCSFVRTPPSTYLWEFG
jgi:hypothetical protein